MSHLKHFANIRRDYGSLSLNEDSMASDPIDQFVMWFEEGVNHEITDPTAMVLATVDEQGRPDSRVVLLKGIEQGNFLFYTNYQSTKAVQIQTNPYAALNFYWPQMVRQIRIRGKIQKTSIEQSDNYFSSRPTKSQLSAIISPQSQEISSRAFLEQKLDDLEQQSEHNPLSRPQHWGGYQVIPYEIEFWQGRDNRLHDRILYFKQNKSWLYRRLAP